MVGSIRRHVNRGAEARIPEANASTTVGVQLPLTAWVQTNAMVTPVGTLVRILARYNRSTFMPLAPGTRLGPYEILGPIGAGGMGEVYRARDSRLDRTVAIKVLPPDFSNDPDRRLRFEL